MTSWSFDKIARPRTAQVVLVVFSRGPLSDEESRISPICKVQTVARAFDPRWFDGWRTGSLRAIAERALGADGMRELDAAAQMTLVAVDAENPDDLAYLQAAWATARSLVARGGDIVLDALAMRFERGTDVPPAEAPLDVRREVSLIFETDAQRPDDAHAIHTRGMKKFGAPDLVALCADADAELVGNVLRKVADVIARGETLATPRHPVDVAPNVTWYLVADEHGLGQLLQLNNAARVLVDQDGRDLVGVSKLVN